MSEWVSIEEKDPEHKQQVWVNFTGKNGNKCQGYAIYDAKNKDFFIETENLELKRRRDLIQNGFEVDDITHWMPLPAPPVL